MEIEMRKLLTVVIASVVVAGFTMDSASARHHHRHGKMSHGMTMKGGSNAELRGNNGNSASGSNSLANPNNATGPH
jgi:hypothetical protein